MELASTIQDEFLTCHICLEGYTKPKQLPCLHTFCLQCLSHYITQTVGQSGVLSVPCPICRRVCVPPDPDPRKLRQWADQFPDNFFLASLRETVETRKSEQAEDIVTAETSDSDSSPNKTSYFMGEVNTCSKHLTHRMTHFCLSGNVGVCEVCLGEEPHSACKDKDHMDTEEARNKATDLLTKYRQEMEQLKQEVVGVKQAFSRKPRRLQMKKEEVEISVSEYFSALRSTCAKLLLSKEREMMDSLNKVTEDESQRTGDAQKKCDDVMSSMNNTVSLLDTVIRSGPFNAMHVLARVEGQVTNIGRLVIKMDQEAKADSVRFCPPSQSLEDHLSSLQMGKIVADFSSGEMAVDSNDDRQSEDRSSALSADRGQTEVPDSHPDAQRAADGSVQTLESQMSELNLGDIPTAANLAERPDCDVDTSRPYPSAPSLDDAAPPPYYAINSSDQPSSSPSAPPISQLSPTDLYNRSRTSPISQLSPTDLYNRSRTSPAMAEAFQHSMRKVFTCTPLMVFSANMPNESRRGGICGAAMVDQVNRAAFVDRHNHSVKIIDLHLAQVVGFLHLGDLEPWDITYVSARKELVVVCPGSAYLLFIPTESRRLAIKYYYRTSHGYCCVAHLKDDQFSGGICAPFGPPAVHIFDVKGTVLRQILPGEFQYPRTIFADSTGSQIVVSDWTSNVVVLVTADGEVLGRYREAPSPKGVTLSQLTSLLHVLDSKWNRLHLLDMCGQCLGTGKVEGCRDPRMVVVVPTSSSHFPDEELTVIADGNNALHVMSMTTPGCPLYTDVQSTV